jgi:hypothetical protein
VLTVNGVATGVAVEICVGVELGIIRVGEGVADGTIVDVDVGVEVGFLE